MVIPKYMEQIRGRNAHISSGDRIVCSLHIHILNKMSFIHFSMKDNDMNAFYSVQ
jgi:hypothetical protein